MIRLFLALTTLLAQWFSTLAMSWPGEYLGNLFTHVGIESSGLLMSALLAGVVVIWLWQREHIKGWTTGLKQILAGLLVILLLHSAVIGAVGSVFSWATGKPDGGYVMLAVLVALGALGPWLHAVILAGNVLLVVGVIRYLRGPVLEPQAAAPRKPEASQRQQPPAFTRTLEPDAGVRVPKHMAKEAGNQGRNANHNVPPRAPRG